MQSSSLGKRKTTPTKQSSRKKKKPPTKDTEHGGQSNKDDEGNDQDDDLEPQGDKDAEGEKDQVVEGSKEKDVEEEPEEIDNEDIIPQSVTKPGGSEFVDSLTLNKDSLPPMIPLCRCLVNERVRELRKDLSLLKKVFEDEGYIMMKGMFVLSVNLPNGTTRDVDDDITKTWDKNWHLVNKEFEDELLANEQWSILRGKMFYVWEGNHRTASWLESIREVARNDKKKHVRVLAQFIVPTLQDEMKLIAALQRLNM